MSTTATVVLHGFTGSAAAMAPLTSRLPDPVLALDLPGHGSGPVSDDPADYTMSAAVAGVVDATAYLGRFALVGYSMGGRVALHIAMAHPDRVAALALIGARAGIDDPAERAERITAPSPIKWPGSYLGSKSVRFPMPATPLTWKHPVQPQER